MSSPRWSVLVVALLLGLTTGDCLLQQPAEAHDAEVNIEVPQQLETGWEPISNYHE